MSEFRLVGVLHLPPLPGAANYDGRSVRDMAAVAAADAMVQDASDEPQPAGVAIVHAIGVAFVRVKVRPASRWVRPAGWRAARSRWPT